MTKWVFRAVRNEWQKKHPILSPQVLYFSPAYMSQFIKECKTRRYSQSIYKINDYKDIYR